MFFLQKFSFTKFDFELKILDNEKQSFLPFKFQFVCLILLTFFVTFLMSPLFFHSEMWLFHPCAQISNAKNSILNHLIPKHVFCYLRDFLVELFQGP